MSVTAGRWSAPTARHSGTPSASSHDGRPGRFPTPPRTVRRAFVDSWVCEAAVSGRAGQQWDCKPRCAQCCSGTWISLWITLWKLHCPFDAWGWPCRPHCLHPSPVRSRLEAGANSRSLWMFHVKHAADRPRRGRAPQGRAFSRLRRLTSGRIARFPAARKGLRASSAYEAVALATCLRPQQ